MTKLFRLGLASALVAVLFLLAFAGASQAKNRVAWATPQAIAKKIHGFIPQLTVDNTSAPSIITSTKCHGLGKAHKKGKGKKAVRKYSRFRCTASTTRGRSAVWARALPGGKFCASSTGLASCPAAAPAAGDPRICGNPPAPPTADPNNCVLSATEASVSRAMKVWFKNPDWTPGQVHCKGSNLKFELHLPAAQRLRRLLHVEHPLQADERRLGGHARHDRRQRRRNDLHRAAEREDPGGQARQVDDGPDPHLHMSDASASAVSPPTPAPGATAARPKRPLPELLPRGMRAAAVLAVSAALVAADFVHFGASDWAFIGLVLCPVLVLLTAIDLEHRLLPNLVVLPATLAVAAVVAVSQPHALVGHLAAGVALGGFFFATGAFFPGSIGMGDAKLGLLLGVALGSKTVPAVEFALLAVLVVALGIVASQGMSARKKAIAFGPFLALGAILGFFIA